MSALIIFIVLAVGVSFLCSILEAVILSISPGYLESLKHSSPAVYNRLRPLRDNIERPLAAILSLNTVAHTIGATGAGAQAQEIFGDELFTLFSVILTLIILIFSEIIPKSIGARYWKALSPFSARVLPILVVITLPLVWISEKISLLLKGDDEEKITRDEFSAIAEIGLKDGAIHKEEYETFKSLLQFPDQPIGSIVKLIENAVTVRAFHTIEEVFQLCEKERYSRYPVIGDHEDDVRGYILRTSVLSSIARGERPTVEDITVPMLHVTEDIPIRNVFKKLIKRQEHMAGVIKEDSSFLGVVTLEDIIETILGLDIKDETDEEEDV
ncbi:CNNM domain-containing protein [Bacteriovorax sp. DB6_IX]|uniref:CNNM domain-containing protein n=1 Tax=Bacteriovorax sp. DB6_IX TaxID=1353530 RepID=UPI00038A1AC8|nr:CNNM domain-containing protein [Bacteriovorax sp. DB6_IX]EQC52693.1 membrane protein, PF01595 family [Bacteriovorax sp. DB6_IX]